MECIVFLLFLLTLTSAQPGNQVDNTEYDLQDQKLTKRVSCDCKGKSGTYWFGISKCHDPNSLQCSAILGVCCVPPERS
uniref:mRNA n=1 Tax=Oulactis sp. TaxID=2093647 RepID=A0A4D8XQV7_OULSP|nr:mRNA [Oulactis sp. MM-2018]